MVEEQKSRQGIDKRILPVIMSLEPDCFHGKRLGAIAIAQGRDDSTLEQGNGSKDKKELHVFQNIQNVQ